jgi:hypothetical protein
MMLGKRLLLYFLMGENAVVVPNGPSFMGL